MTARGEAAPPTVLTGAVDEVDYRVLGPLEVLVRGAPADLGTPKQRALLVALLVRRNEVVTSDRLVEDVWEGRAPRTVQHSVQAYVSTLRRALGGAGDGTPIQTVPGGYVLRVGRAALDTDRFEDLLQHGTAALRDGDAASAAGLLRKGAEMWRGVPYGDLAYAQVVQAEQHRLEELHVTCLELLGSALLDSGDPTSAASTLRAAALADPLRERVRGLLMLALYRTGRQADALAGYDELRRALDAELGLRPSPDLQVLQERILLHDRDLDGPRPPTPGRAGANPYKGLHAFGERDHREFFGREAVVAELHQAIARHPLVTLVGPSGSGKSSVLHAGLLADLSGAGDGDGRPPAVSVVPGAHPYSVLRRELDAIGDDTAALLVVDQFEEVFTLASDAERHRALDLLAAVADTGAPRVVLGMRGDFYDAPFVHPTFARHFRVGVVAMAPLSAEEAEQVVRRPAETRGVAVEPGLVVELVTELLAQPGALPLLQYSLTELFERAGDDGLTLAAYHRLGGLRGALARRAEDVLDGLDGPGQELARQVFLRLAHVGTAEVTRRRAPVRELLHLGLDTVALQDVLDGFGRHRLLTFDRDPATGAGTVEVAHEALLREWGRLRDWLTKHREDLVRRQGLDLAVGEWDASGRRDEHLLTGARMDGFLAWRSGTDLQLAAGERDLLAASLERRDAADRLEQERRRRERSLAARARRRTWASALAIAVATTAATVAALALLPPTPPDVVLLVDPVSNPGVGPQMIEGVEVAVERAAADPLTRLVYIPEQLQEDWVPGTGMVISVLGYEEWVRDLAAEHPDTEFALLDVAPEPDDPTNLTHVAFATHEGSFLAGAAAALTSTTGRVGFVGGADLPLIHGFQAGFEAGARHVDPDVNVAAVYLTPAHDSSGFSSSTLAVLAAGDLYSDGADVVFHAAGQAGLGVFEAAAQHTDASGEQVWAIGVDDDQHVSVAEQVPPDVAERWRPHILTSMVKRYDTVAADLISAHLSGAATGGEGSVHVADGAMELATSGGQLVPVRGELEALEGELADGLLDVPSVPAGDVVLYQDTVADR